MYRNRFSRVVRFYGGALGIGVILALPLYALVDHVRQREPEVPKLFTAINGNLSCGCTDPGVERPCEYFAGLYPPEPGRNGGRVLLRIVGSGQLLGFRCETGRLTIFSDDPTVRKEIVPVRNSGNVEL
jgi:hypothetical protein